MRDGDKYVMFTDVKCTKDTQKAMLVVINGIEHWMPKSQLHRKSEVQKWKDEGTLIVTEWVANQKELPGGEYLAGGPRTFVASAPQGEQDLPPGDDDVPY